MSILVNVGGVWKDNCAPQQNIGGVWKTPAAIDTNIDGVYRNVYKDIPTGALYWLGNEMTALSGGWGINYSPTYYGTLTKNSDNLYMLTRSGGGALDLQTTNKIDLTAYKTLKFEVSGNFSYQDAQNTTKIGVTSKNTLGITDWTNNGQYTALTVLPTGTQAKTIYAADITSLTGLYYVKMSLPATASGYDATVTKVWLE